MPREMKAYPRYKDSGIQWLGEVPEHWGITRLRFCLKLNPSKQEISHLPQDTKLSFIPMNAVGEEGTLDLSNTREIEEVESGYSFFRENDVAIAKITPCFENGKGCIFKNLVGGYGFGTTELTVMRPELVIPSFLFYHTVSHLFRTTGTGLMQGSAGQKRVPDDFIRNYPIGLPSIQEQKIITSYLDKATARIDALIGKKEKMIELLQEKRIALITHAVTKGLDPNVKMKDSGIKWLGEVPEHWEINKLKHVATYNDDTLSEITDPEYNVLYTDISGVSRDQGIINKEEMTFEDAPSRARRIVKDGDTIISTVRTYLRAIAPIINPENNLIVSTGFAVIRAVNISKDFLFFVLSSDYFIESVVSKSVGASYPSINASELAEIFVLLPPIEEQKRIENWVKEKTSRMNEIQTKIDHSITLLREYRSSLIHDAVTGKIDLRDAL